VFAERGFHDASMNDIAEAAGVTLALENRLSAEENLDLLTRIDSAAVGVYHDTGNPLSWGDDPAAMIGAYGEAMTRLHVKDLGPDDGWTMLGDGGVDFDAVVGRYNSAKTVQSSGGRQPDVGPQIVETLDPLL
jgi:sugar phosphate isomerase/epimerase